MDKVFGLGLVMMVIAALPGMSQTDRKDIFTKEVRYKVGSEEFVGLLAYDKSLTKAVPGILVVHEWQGINDYAKKRAVDLAAEGYVALALDMYGGGKEVPVSEARTLSGKVGSDFPLIRARFDAALAELKKEALVDPKKLAAIGYCFGGGIVLNMARMGTDLTGIVSFHGSVNTGLTAKMGDIKTPILAIQGDGDPSTPLAKREALTKEMADAQADFELIVYPGVAAHNFTNPLGSTYYAKEATQAWDTMKEYFQKIFS